MKGLLLYIWQLPQNILGLFLVLFLGAIKITKRGESNVYVSSHMSSGVSLGQYIVLSKAFLCLPDVRRERAIAHEYGHSLQSRKLGWLYLIVIGLPSLLGNVYDQVAHADWPYAKSLEWYYKQPWEAWADKLGRVSRH